jgi:hypothetical protein
MVLAIIAGVWAAPLIVLVAWAELERRKPLTTTDEYCSRVDDALDARADGWRC